jgi:hypothetical protein
MQRLKKMYKYFIMHVHCKNMKKICLTSITKMLHVFPEVDSKHSKWPEIRNNYRKIVMVGIYGRVEFLLKSRTSLCINIYNLTPVESNSDESKFRCGVKHHNLNQTEMPNIVYI